MARPWPWDATFMLGHFGWRAVVAMVVSSGLYFAILRREFARLGAVAPAPDVEDPENGSTSLLGTSPAWITVIHVLFMAWTVVNAHYPVLFIGEFFFFIDFVRGTAPLQSQLELKAPLLVGFFLGGLVIHGGLQGWWIQPLLASLSEHPLFIGATVLTAFNDNALITHLATLVPDLGSHLKIALDRRCWLGSLAARFPRLVCCSGLCFRAR